MQGRWKNQSDFFRRKINIAYFYILFAKSYSLSKVYGFERDKTYKRWIAIDENIVKVYTDFITCFVFLGKIYKSDQFQGRENKNMKNMKVRKLQRMRFGRCVTERQVTFGLISQMEQM